MLITLRVHTSNSALVGIESFIITDVNIQCGTLVLMELTIVRMYQLYLHRKYPHLQLWKIVSVMYFLRFSV